MEEKKRKEKKTKEKRMLNEILKSYDPYPQENDWRVKKKPLEG